MCPVRASRGHEAHTRIIQLRSKTETEQNGRTSALFRSLPLIHFPTLMRSLTIGQSLLREVRQRPSYWIDATPDPPQGQTLRPSLTTSKHLKEGFIAVFGKIILRSNPRRKSRRGATVSNPFCIPASLGSSWWVAGGWILMEHT